MNTSRTHRVKRGTQLTGMALSLLVVASCATAPTPQGAVQVRDKLTTLQNDAKLAPQARQEIREAEEAVVIAEKPENDEALSKHRIYMADRKLSIAQAKATTRYAEVQRDQLSEEREQARLLSRTREVSRAREEANTARDATDAAQKLSAEAATTAALQTAELQREIEALQAKPTDRGLVLTLGDVLFASGSAELQSGANSNLNRLVGFLNQYPERNVQIEGHTDNVGSSEYNQGLSQRRADSVRNYLARQGIDSQRLSASGIGMDRPVANNETAAGRQQNRRVEIIIDNPY